MGSSLSNLLPFLAVQSAIESPANTNISEQLTTINYAINTTLRQVIFIHRHGDRTPTDYSPKDSLADEPFWAFHGDGQLTNRGKARLYQLGKLMRSRYGPLLGGSVNKKNRISRSSGSSRCIESAQVFLASFLGLDTSNSPDASPLVWDGEDNKLAHLWQPASIISVPVSIDGMLAETGKCEASDHELRHVIENSDLVRGIYEEYKHEREVLERVYGFEISRFIQWAWARSQIEVEKSYFGHKIEPEIMAIFDRLGDAAQRAMTAYQSTLKSKRLRSGLLINDMIMHMKTAMAQMSDLSLIESKKFVHYTAHDLTLVVLLGMLGQWEKQQERPGFASNIAIELHQDNQDNVWFVKIFYMQRVPETPVELDIEACTHRDPKSRCTLSRFESLVEKYMIPDWQTWMRECRNDLSKIDPYKG